LELCIVLQQKSLLRRWVGEPEAQAGDFRIRLTPHEPGVEPLDGPAVRADYGERQQ